MDTNNTLRQQDSLLQALTQEPQQQAASSQANAQISMDQVNTLLNEQGRQQQQQFAQFMLAQQQQPHLFLNTSALTQQPQQQQQQQATFAYNPVYQQNQQQQLFSQQPQQQQQYNMYAQQTAATPAPMTAYNSLQQQQQQYPQQQQQFLQQPMQMPQQQQYQHQDNHNSNPSYAEDILQLIMEQQHRIHQLEQELDKSKQFVTTLQDYIQKLENERDKSSKKSSRYWTQEEHKKFLQAVELYGRKDVKAIANFVGSRSTTQVRTHAQKFYAKVEREKRKREDGDDGIEDESSQDDTMPPRPAKVAAI